MRLLLLPSLLSVPLVVSSAACLPEEGPLPPLEALYLPSPRTQPAASGAKEQAACASADVFAGLEERIDAYNADVLVHLDAFEKLYDEGPAERTPAGRVYVSSGAEGTVTLTTVEAGDKITFSVTVANDGGDEETETMSGTMDGDKAGTLSATNGDGTLAVVWSTEGDELQVTRSQTASGDNENAVYTRSPDEVNVVFQSEADAIIARWNPQTKAGVLIAADVPGCWGEPDGDDFCDIDCSELEGVNVEP